MAAFSSIVTGVNLRQQTGFITVWGNVYSTRLDNGPLTTTPARSQGFFLSLETRIRPWERITTVVAASAARYAAIVVMRQLCLSSPDSCPSKRSKRFRGIDSNPASRQWPVALSVELQSKHSSSRSTFSVASIKIFPPPPLNAVWTDSQAHCPHGKTTSGGVGRGGSVLWVRKCEDATRWHLSQQLLSKIVPATRVVGLAGFSLFQLKVTMLAVIQYSRTGPCGSTSGSRMRAARTTCSPTQATRAWGHRPVSPAAVAWRTVTHRPGCET